MNTLSVMIMIVYFQFFEKKY